MSAAGPRLALLDYGAGNLVSIEQALVAVGAQVGRATGPADLRGVDVLVVPGVGAAAPAMARLAESGLLEPVREWLAAGRPYLGICLGLQLLFEASDEDGARTFGRLPGRVERLAGVLRLPHIGWNSVERGGPHPLFAGIPPEACFYFVHSYAGLPPGGLEHPAVLGSTTHGGSFPSALVDEALVGVQFHPERSGPDGLRLLANALAILGGSTAFRPSPATAGPA
ncbi:MAG TPA: imidazole glycerol phosphate synthase subunit HisH [Candidatus Limnocylindrales bacterium]|nr:imidazole glycerol phosphate synthase subunit HisH [Candidatus Limnocylindrales bacterium]